MFKRLAEIERDAPFTIQVDGEVVTVYRGETLATVLLALGKIAMGKTFQKRALRGYFCGMGICHECLVELQDGTKVRACQTLAEPWMKIKTRT
jgi:predicted molibdopterin-dependent oxidoreductase YjgC